MFVLYKNTKITIKSGVLLSLLCIHVHSSHYLTYTACVSVIRLIFYPLVKISIVGSLCDREVASSVSDLQGLNFESCVWRAVSSQHPQDVLLAQFSLYVHKNGLKPDRFHLYFHYFAYERVAGPTTEPIPVNTANTIPPPPPPHP